MPRVVVIGATGQTGRRIVRLLLEEPGVHITAVGRTQARLDALRASLPSWTARLRTATGFAQDTDRIQELARDAALVIGATSRSEEAVLIAHAAVGASASYCGVYLSEPDKWRRLRALEPLCRESGVMVVDDAGSHPGLPGAMARWVTDFFPLRAAWIGARFDLVWDRLDVAQETIEDFASELAVMDPSQFVGGRLLTGFRHMRRFDFGDGRGPQSCTPMMMEEVRELVRTSVIPSAGFFVAGFGAPVDYVILPLSLMLTRLHQGAAGRFLFWGLRRFASREGAAVIQLEGAKATDGAAIRARLSHPDTYHLTAASVVATVLQILDRPRPGVWTQAAFVDPARLFADLARMAVRVEGPAMG